MSLRGAHVLLRPVDAESDAEPLSTSRTRRTATRRSGRISSTAPTRPGVLPPMLTGASVSGPALFHARASRRRTASRASPVPPDRARAWRHRDRPHLVRRRRCSAPGRHRDDLPAGAARLRRPRLSPARVEVQRAQRGLASCRRALRVPLRGRLPKHRVVKGRNRDTAWYAITESVAGDSARSRRGSPRRTWMARAVRGCRSAGCRSSTSLINDPGRHGSAHRGSHVGR